MHNLAPAAPGATTPPTPLRRGIRFPAPRSLLVHIVRLSFNATLLSVVALVMAATLPALWGRHSVLIQGGSMGDALPVGSMAVMETIDADAIQVGDVIAVGGEKGLPYVHRVVSIEVIDGRRVATLKGDANRAVDPTTIVLTGQGDRLDYYVPWMAYLLVYVRTPLGLVGLVVLAVALLGWRPSSRRRRRSRVASMADLGCPVQNGNALRSASVWPPPNIGLGRLRPNRRSAAAATAESKERWAA